MCVYVVYRRMRVVGEFWVATRDISFQLFYFKHLVFLYIFSASLLKSRQIIFLARDETYMGFYLIFPFFFVLNVGSFGAYIRYTIKCFCNVFR